jgi:DNA-binding NarL/FixJ family response regulator
MPPRPPRLSPLQKDKPQKRRNPSPVPPRLSPPQGLEVYLVEAEHGEELAVFSFDANATWQPPSCLTKAEAEVATLAVQGSSNADIAARRGTAVRTVANQIASIFDKLGIASRDELWMVGSR